MEEGEETAVSIFAGDKGLNTIVKKDRNIARFVLDGISGHDEANTQRQLMAHHEGHQLEPDLASIAVRIQNGNDAVQVLANIVQWGTPWCVSENLVISKGSHMKGCLTSFKLPEYFEY